jgi:hypothetical protein
MQVGDFLSREKRRAIAREHVQWTCESDASLASLEEGKLF